MSKIKRRKVDHVDDRKNDCSGAWLLRGHNPKKGKRDGGIRAVSKGHKAAVRRRDRK